MAFRFRLQGILRLREEEERQAQLILGKLRSQEYALKTVIRETEVEQDTWNLKYNEYASSESSQSEVILVEQYLIALEARQRHCEAELMKLNRVIQEAVKKVEIAYKARRQIEILRDKQKEAYDLEMKAKEQRQVSEMNILRFLFKAAQKEEQL